MKLTPLTRTRAAQLLMGATGLGIGSLSWIYGEFRWPVAAAAALVAASGLLYGARSIVGQVIARAGSWAVLAPSSIALFFSLAKLQAPTLTTVAATAATGGALLLARPMLHTPEAKKAFAPRVLRRWLLAASTSSIAISAYGLLFASYDFLMWRDDRLADVVMMALSSMLLASAIGTVRMRAWGALLSALSFGFAATAWPLLHRGFGPGVLVAAAPGLMVLLGILAARAGLVSGDAKSRVETSDFEPAREDVHVRVALGDGAPLSPSIRAGRSALSEPEEHEESSTEQAEARRAVA